MVPNRERGPISPEVHSYVPVTACNESSRQKARTFALWGNEIPLSPTPLGGRYRSGGELATLNFGELYFPVSRVNKGKKKGRSC